MKFFKPIVYIGLLILIGGSFALAASKKGASSVKLETVQEKVGYSLGLDIGRNLNRQKIEIDADMFIAGFKTGLSGSESLLNDTQIQEIMMEFQQQLMLKRQTEHTKKLEENTKKSEVFLQANAKKEGIVTLPSGIQYRVIKNGDGDKPSASDEIIAHYKGTLIDGSVFDSSYDRNEPLKISVSGVIPGWTEILQLMPVGSKWEVVIPAEHAYGAAGAPPVIGPNETLIFEIELLKIVK